MNEKNWNWKSWGLALLPLLELLGKDLGMSIPLWASVSLALARGLGGGGVGEWARSTLLPLRFLPQPSELERPQQPGTTELLQCPGDHPRGGGAWCAPPPFSLRRGPAALSPARARPGGPRPLL